MLLSTSAPAPSDAPRPDGPEEARPPLPPAEELPTYPAEPEGAGAPKRSGVGWFGLAVVVLAALALLAYLMAQREAPPDNPDLLARAAAAAEAVALEEPTQDAGAARDYVRAEFGWRVAVPQFAAADLQGVGIAEIAPDVEVPVFLYSGARGQQAAAFVLNYALLDQVPDRLRLSAADYDRLADAEYLAVRQVGGADVLLWRHRDDLFVVVTELDPALLTDGLSMAAGPPAP